MEIQGLLGSPFLCSIIWVLKKHPEFWSIFLSGKAPPGCQRYHQALGNQGLSLRFKM
jgi:hypothetical protein